MANPKCPNISHADWKDLEKEFGKEKAYLAYFRHDDAGLKGIPTVEEARNLLHTTNTEKATGLIKTVFKGIQSVLAPANLDRETSDALREANSEKARAESQLKHVLEPYRKYYDERTDEQKKGARAYFEDDVKTANKLGYKVTETDKSFKKIYREFRDDTAEELARVTPKMAEKMMESYFPHIWEKPGMAQTFTENWLRGNSLEGGKEFLKKRIHQYISDGEAAGMKLKFDNPVDEALMKNSSVRRYIMAHDFIDSIENKKLIKVGELPPEGYTIIEDAAAKVYDKTGRKFQGQYAIKTDGARIINNFLSRGMEGNTAYEVWRTGTNIINNIQLGGSLFHFGFTSMETAIKDFSNGISDIKNGELSRGFTKLGQTFVPFLSSYLNKQLGKGVHDAYLDASAHPEYQKIVGYLTEGGIRASMDKNYKGNMSDVIKKLPFGIVSDGLGAAAKLFEMPTKWVMEEVVPQQKMGVAYELAKREMEQHPEYETDHVARREAMRKIVDHVDDVMGQLVYDNIFWDKTFKQTLMSSIRSVGWNLGTWRALGGGAVDAVKYVAGKVQGGDPEWTHRMSYAMSLPIVVGIYGAVTQKLLTGKDPDSLKDLYYPMTGRKDENGKDERIQLPTYMKDIASYKKDFWGTLGNKLHPSITTIIQLGKNKDYWGTTIRNEDDGYLQNGLNVLKHIGKQAVPFSVSGAVKSQERGTDPIKMLLPFIGVTAAPANINRTEAENLAMDISRKRYNVEAGRSPATTEQQQTKHKLIQELRTKSPTYEADLAKAKADGIISDKDIKSIRKGSMIEPLQASVQHFDAKDMIKIWNVADDAEKKELEPKMRRALQNVRTLPVKQARDLVDSNRALFNQFRVFIR